MEKYSKWVAPEGEMILFNNETELKEFFCNLVLDTEDYEEMGIILPVVDHDEDEFDVMYDGKVNVYPVFDKDVDYQYGHVENDVVFDIDKVSVNKEIYYKFPCIVYINISKSFDRFGPVSVKIMNVTPLEDIATVNSIKEYQTSKQGEWESNYQEMLEFEKLRDQYINSEKA